MTNLYTRSYINTSPKKEPLKLNDMANVCLDDFDFEKYFAPEIILPFQSSRGCYWGKCSFCDQGFGQNYNVKNPQKLVDEFKEIKEKYNIDKFEFIDESVGPTYLKELSDTLEEENVKVNYFMDARLESAFSYEILNKAHRYGLKMVLIASPQNKGSLHGNIQAYHLFHTLQQESQH